MNIPIPRWTFNLFRIEINWLGRRSYNRWTVIPGCFWLMLILLNLSILDLENKLCKLRLILFIFMRDYGCIVVKILIWVWLDRRLTNIFEYIVAVVGWCTEFSHGNVAFEGFIAFFFVTFENEFLVNKHFPLFSFGASMWSFVLENRFEIDIICLHLIVFYL